MMNPQSAEITKLSAAEEQLMAYIWNSEHTFMKDLLEAYPKPKPAGTTISTMLKRMTEKGAIGYREYGKSRAYFALVEKDRYFSKQLSGLTANFFDDSPLKFASFFIKQSSMSTAELEALKKIVDREIQNSK